MSGGVEDRDLGYEAVVGLLRSTPGVGVSVGVQQEEGRQRDPDSRATLAEYATFNEFGTATTPERPFLRGTADAKREEWGTLLVEAITEPLDDLAGVPSGQLGNILAGQARVREELGKVGLVAARDVQQTIRDLRTPPNAKATIKAKGSSNPLVDSGRLRQSIRHKVEGL